MFLWSQLLVLPWIFTMVSMISAVEANCSTGICFLNEKDKTKEAMPSNLVVMKEEEYIRGKATSGAIFLPRKRHNRDAVKLRKPPSRKLLQLHQPDYATFSNLDAVRNVDSNSAVGSVIFIPETEYYIRITLTEIIMKSKSDFFKFDGEKLLTKACLVADHSESLEFYIVHPDLPGIAGILTINVKETKPVYKDIPPFLEAEVIPNIINQTVFAISFENEVCVRFKCKIKCDNHQHPFWIGVERNVQTSSFNLIFGFIYKLRVTCFDSSASNPDINESNDLTIYVTFHLASSITDSTQSILGSAQGSTSSRNTMSTLPHILSGSNTLQRTSMSTISSTTTLKPLVAVLPPPLPSQNFSPRPTSDTLSLLSLQPTLPLHSVTFRTLAANASLEIASLYETTSTSHVPSTMFKSAGQIIILDGNITLTSNQEVGETVFTLKPISTQSRVLMVESSKYFDLYNFDVYTKSCLPAWHKETLLFYIVQQYRRAIGPILNSLEILVLPTVPKIYYPSDNEEVYVSVQRISNLISSDILDIEMEFSTECVSVKCVVYCTNDQKGFWIAVPVPSLTCVSLAMVTLVTSLLFLYDWSRGSTLRTYTVGIHIGKPYQLVLTCRENVMSTAPDEYSSKIHFSVTFVNTVPNPTTVPIITTTLSVSTGTTTMLSVLPGATNATPASKQSLAASISTLPKGTQNTYLSSFSSRLSLTLPRSTVLANIKELFVISSLESSSSASQTPLKTSHSRALTTALTVPLQTQRQTAEKSFFDESINVSLLSVGVAITSLAVVGTLIMAIYKASLKSTVGPQTLRRSER